MRSSPDPYSSRRGARASWPYALSVLLGTLGAPLAHAHGPAPAITGVLAGSAQQPTLVALTEGLATLGGERAFVCPARLGLTQPPLAGRAPDGRAWLATPRGALSFGAADQLDTRLPSSRAIAFATGRDALFALTYESSGSELLRVSEVQAGALYRSTTPWLTLTHDGAALWLARGAGRELEVLRMDEQGQEQQRHTLTLAVAPRALQLRSAAGRTFLHVMLDAGAELLELSGEAPGLRAAAGSPIFGPVEVAGRLYIGHHQTLRMLADGAEARELQVPEAVHCLEQQAGVAYLCLQTRLLRLDQWLERGAEAPPLFKLAELVGPSPTGAAHDELCKLQWLTFQADLLRAGIAAEQAAPLLVDAGPAVATPATPDDPQVVVAPDAAVHAELDPHEPDAPPGSCSLSARADGRTFLATCLLWVALFTRRYTRGRPSSAAQRVRTR